MSTWEVGDLLEASPRAGVVTEMSNCAGRVLHGVDALVVEFIAADRVFGLLVCMLREHLEPYLPRIRRSASVAAVKLTRDSENDTVGGPPQRGPSPTSPRSPAEGLGPFPSGLWQVYRPAFLSLFGLSVSWLPYGAASSFRSGGSPGKGQGVLDVLQDWGCG